MRDNSFNELMRTIGKHQDLINRNTSPLNDLVRMIGTQSAQISKSVGSFNDLVRMIGTHSALISKNVGPFNNLVRMIGMQSAQISKSVGPFNDLIRMIGTQSALINKNIGPFNDLIRMIGTQSALISKNVGPVNDLVRAFGDQHRRLTAAFIQNIALHENTLSPDFFKDETWKQLREWREAISAEPVNVENVDNTALALKIDELVLSVENLKVAQKEQFKTLADQINEIKDSKLKVVILSFVLPIVLSFLLVLSNPELQQLANQIRNETPKQTAKSFQKKMAEHDPILLSNEIRFVSASALIVRAGPGRKHKKLDTLPYATIVQVLETQKDWSLIRHPSFGNETDFADGWVFTRYVHKITNN